MTRTDLDQQLAELQSAAYVYAARHQFIPDLTWPEGVRIAVNFTCDFDAMLLRRLLPFIDGVDVHLMGSGLPTFWVFRAGDITLTLALTGFTAANWSQALSFDLLLPDAVGLSAVRFAALLGEEVARVLTGQRPLNVVNPEVYAAGAARRAR